MEIEPVTLQGPRVRLVPLALEHLDALCDIGLDARLWTWTGGRYECRDDMKAYIERAMARPDALPFATTIRESGEIVGSTSYLNVDEQNRRVEIGFTWVTPAWQRTAVNTEAKLLMFAHAFESLGCVRVELKTDARNERSRAAIARLGAAEEGTLRHHMIRRNGTYRDSVYFSVLREEWPAVASGLESRIEARDGRP